MIAVPREEAGDAVRVSGEPDEGREADALELSNRFLLTSLAFQRNRQLRDGARARVGRDGHKATYLAVLEVLANTISWSRV
jgi:DNA-directed RNA polymerase subunit K/omega